MNGDNDFRLKFFSLSFVSVYSPSVKLMLPHDTSIKICDMILFRDLIYNFAMALRKESY